MDARPFTSARAESMELFTPIKAEVGSMTMKPRNAWLFTRGRESVRLEVREVTTGVQLVVCGPGVKRETYEFPDMLALMVREAELERSLVRLGFTLEEFISDRRRYPR